LNIFFASSDSSYSAVADIELTEEETDC